MDFNDVINQRRSVREYTDKDVEDEKIQKILEIVNLAPSAGNLQAYKIYVVKSKEKREALDKIYYKTGMLTQASVVMAFAADKKASGDRYKERGEELYAIQDATIAAPYAQLAATSLGLGTCWVGAFDEEEAGRILGVGEGERVIAMLPIGYYKELPERKGRRDIMEKVKEL